MTSKHTRNNSRSDNGPPTWALGLLALVVLVFLALTSVWLFRTVFGAASEWEITNPEFDEASEPVSEGDNPVDPVPGAADEGQSIIPNPLLQKWSGHDRVTILILGIDQRCDEDGPTHTDSIMIVTIDPLTMSAALLSLPRDLWVEIPGRGRPSLH